MAESNEFFVWRYRVQLHDSGIYIFLKLNIRNFFLGCFNGL